MIQVTAAISIGEDEIDIAFVASSGPGGQNVNKVATAAQLRFDVLRSPSLPADVKHRLIRLGGRRVTTEGVLLIDARRHRTQLANRRDAVERLIELIRLAAIRPRPRRATAPTAGARRRRLEHKHIQSQSKTRRRWRPGESE